MDQDSAFREACSINPVPLGDEKSTEGQSTTVRNRADFTRFAQIIL